MARTFVRIVNRKTYTTVDKARAYVDRRLAEIVLLSLSRQILEIRMLEAAELAVLKSHMSRARRDENVDDGTERRWTKRESGGIPVQQLLPVKHVGTSNRTSKTRDTLIRPHGRQDPGRTVMMAESV